MNPIPTSDCFLKFSSPPILEGEGGIQSISGIIQWCASKVCNIYISVKYKKDFGQTLSFRYHYQFDNSEIIKIM